MGTTCNRNRREDEYIQVFGGETIRKGTIRKTEKQMGEQY
jgi:hypothetical protein